MATASSAAISRLSQRAFLDALPHRASSPDSGRVARSSERPIGRAAKTMGAGEPHVNNSERLIYLDSRRGFCPNGRATPPGHEGRFFVIAAKAVLRSERRSRDLHRGGSQCLKTSQYYLAWPLRPCRSP